MLTHVEPLAELTFRSLPPVGSPMLPNSACRSTVLPITLAVVPPRPPRWPSVMEPLLSARLMLLHSVELLPKQVLTVSTCRSPVVCVIRICPGAWAFRTPNRSIEERISRKFVFWPIVPVCAVRLMLTPTTSGPASPFTGGFTAPTGASTIEPGALSVVSSSVDLITPTRRLPNCSVSVKNPLMSPFTLPSPSVSTRPITLMCVAPAVSLAANTLMLPLVVTVPTSIRLKM